MRRLMMRNLLDGYNNNIYKNTLIQIEYIL